MGPADAVTGPAPQFERLVWETVRESRRTWLLLAGAWIGLPLVAGLVSRQCEISVLWVFFGSPRLRRGRRA